MIRTLAILLLFQSMGEVASFALALPVPGPVIGMAMLLMYLALKPDEPDALRGTSLELLRHLSLLFVPAGVGIMVHAGRLADEGVAIVIALVASTAASIAAAALATTWTQRWIERREAAGPRAEP